MVVVERAVAAGGPTPEERDQLVGTKTSAAFGVHQLPDDVTNHLDRSPQVDRAVPGQLQRPEVFENPAAGKHVLVAIGQIDLGPVGERTDGRIERCDTGAQRLVVHGVEEVVAAVESILEPRPAVGGQGADATALKPDENAIQRRALGRQANLERVVRAVAAEAAPLLAIHDDLHPLAARGLEVGVRRAARQREGAGLRMRGGGDAVDLVHSAIHVSGRVHGDELVERRAAACALYFAERGLCKGLPLASTALASHESPVRHSPIAASAPSTIVETA